MGLFSRKRNEVTKVIDLREPKGAKPSWGSPIPCPECSGRGYLDHIDPFREVMFMHCTQCDAKYERTKAEIELQGTPSQAFTV
jgi:hypothetical protein